MRTCHFLNNNFFDLTIYQYGDIRQFYIQSAVSFIENHYTENITVEDMAENLNLNRSYFSKIFKKSTQKSPQEFLITYRVSKSCELLRSTDMTIEEIACQSYLFWLLSPY